MRELPYERGLRDWMEARGMTHLRIVYPRPQAGGDTVAYRLSPARPASALILVTHGAGNDALFAFTGLFKRLLSAGFEIFSFDLDGHGRESTTTFRYPAVTTALEHALAHARAGREELPVHGLGVSLGGSIMLHALAGPLAGLASATLISAPLRIVLSLGRALNELRPVAFATVLRNRQEAGLWGMVPSFGPVKRDVYPLRLAHRPPGSFGYVEELNATLHRLDLEAAASRCEVPTLLAYGSVDRIVPPEQGIRIDRILPRSRLHLVRGGTHLTTVFDDDVVGGMLDWIAGHAPPPASGSPGTRFSRRRQDAGDAGADEEDGGSREAGS